jgi:hypothetical protein
VTRISRETLGLLLGFIGIVVFAGTLPATRIAVSSLARCNFPSVKINETNNASGNTTVKKLGIVTKK